MVALGPPHIPCFSSLPPETHFPALLFCPRGGLLRSGLCSPPLETTTALAQHPRHLGSAYSLSRGLSCALEGAWQHRWSSDARRTFPPVMATSSASRCCQMSPGGQDCPLPLRTTRPNHILCSVFFTTLFTLLILFSSLDPTGAQPQQDILTFT